MKLKTIHGLYVLLAIGVGLWIYQQLDNEERRIRRQLGALQELLEKGGTENDLIAANKARLLGELFSTDFEVHILPLSTSLSDRQGLMRIALQYRRQHERIGVDFRDQELTVDRRLRRAEMGAVAVITGASGGLSRERYRVRFEWTLEDETWKIRRLEVLAVLEGAPAWL